MARKNKFKPDWKFKVGTVILLPPVEISPGFKSAEFVGIVSHYNIYNRSNCKYVCKEFGSGRFAMLDKDWVNKYATIVDNKWAKILYGVSK